MMGIILQLVQSDESVLPDDSGERVLWKAHFPQDVAETQQNTGLGCKNSEGCCESHVRADVCK